MLVNLLAVSLEVPYYYASEHYAQYAVRVLHM
jgi:hypothetical protein